MRLRDLPRQPGVHDVVPLGPFHIGPFTIHAELVCHPGPTVGYRIEADGVSLAYLPDHEPELGATEFPGAAPPPWRSATTRSRRCTWESGRCCGVG